MLIYNLIINNNYGDILDHIMDDILTLAHYIKKN